MNMNTWDLSGALVRIGDLAFDYAKKANKNKEIGFEPMRNVYDNYIWALKRAVSAINVGFDLKLNRDKNGYYTEVSFAYWGDTVGMPWVIER